MGKYKWTSNVRITVRDLAGNILEQTETKNMIVKVGRKMWRDLLRGTITDGKIKYVDLGTDATAVADAQTNLVTGVYRHAITSDAIPADDQYETTCYIAPADYVGWIRELGWFAGVGAVGLGTGIMVARVLWSRNKTNIESVDITRLDSIVEG